MKCLRTGALTTLTFGLGILFFAFGSVKENKLAAMENSVKEQILFGNPNATVNIYLFTDWACPACRALEPRLRSLMPTLTDQANLTFVDIAVHPETLNYSPYNLSFMINNKQKYLELRNALTALSTKTGTPSEADIQKIAKQYRTQFKELNYADIALGLKYWKDLGNQFKIEATPTLVIVNPVTKKGKKLSGLEEITEQNITKAIKTLQ
jgi:protein-disulfide isomerase